MPQILCYSHCLVQSAHKNYFLSFRTEIITVITIASPGLAVFAVKLCFLTVADLQL